MITAMVVNEDRLANHFAKAKGIAFYNEQNELISVSENPAAEGSCCGGKKAALALLKEMNTQQIVVRNVGQRMLARLLDAGIRVYQSTTGGDAVSLLMHRDIRCSELTAAEQGRMSPKHANGHKCKGHSGDSHGGCSHEHGHGKEKGCCGSENGHDDGHRCCGSHSHEQGHGHKHKHEHKHEHKHAHSHGRGNGKGAMGKVTGVSAVRGNRFR